MDYIFNNSDIKQNKFQYFLSGKILKLLNLNYKIKDT